MKLGREQAENHIRQALHFLGREFEGEDAVRMLLAIGWQESRFKHLHQIGGPAHGYWQFEKGGGVRGVMNHPSSKDHAKAICDLLGVPFSEDEIFNKLEDEDTLLAASFARLLLWTDPQPLPRYKEMAWDYYQRNWRPGKPHRKTWDDAWNFANLKTEAMEEESAYTIKYTDEQIDNLPEYLNHEEAEDEGDFWVLSTGLTPTQASECACLKEDDLILDIVPPPGEPDPECDR